MTTFHRQNLQTHVFETAGQIEWLSNSNAMIHFGLDQVGSFVDQWTRRPTLFIIGAYQGA